MEALQGPNIANSEINGSIPIACSGNLKFQNFLIPGTFEPTTVICEIFLLTSLEPRFYPR